MKQARHDGYLMRWDDHEQGARLEIAWQPADDGSRRTPGGDRRTEWTFTFSLDGGRLSLGLHFGVGRWGRTVELSNQPGIFDQIFPGEAGSRGPTPLGRWIADLARANSVWSPAGPAPAGAVAAAGGAAFPLLGHAYDQGAAALSAVPAWATPILAAGNARAAAEVAFGRRTTQPVVPALARSLVHSGESVTVDLLPLGLAVTGRDVLEPDQIARLLDHPGPPHGFLAWPTRELIDALRPTLASLGAGRSLRLLQDVLAHAEGAARLVELSLLFPQVVDRLTGRLAHRADELLAQCRAVLPVDPTPERGRWGPLPARNQPPALTPGAPQRRAGRPVATPGQVHPTAGPDPQQTRNLQARRRALTAPVAPSTGRRAPDVDPDGQLRQRVAALGDRDLGDGFRLKHPRTPADLAAWGDLLSNCLATYGPSVREGRSFILGVEHDGRMVASLEITGSMVIRQFLAARNRPVATSLRHRVCAALVAGGVLDPRRAANQTWLEGLALPGRSAEVA